MDILVGLALISHYRVPYFFITVLNQILMKNNGMKYQKRFLIKVNKNFIETQSNADKDGLIT
jgi:hypothetical protein